MLARMAAIVFIFLCIAVAWAALGGTVMHRTANQDESLKTAVSPGLRSQFFAFSRSLS